MYIYFRLSVVQSSLPLIYFRYGPIRPFSPKFCKGIVFNFVALREIENNERQRPLNKAYTFSHCDEAGRNLSDVWPSTFISGAVQLRSVTEIAPKSPFLSMKRSPFRFCFRIGARANTHSASKASEDFKDANSASQGSHPPWNSSKFDHY